MTARDNCGRTPLMMAAVRGATDCVTLLLARFGNGVGEQLGMVDYKGNSAAHIASGRYYPLVFALLLDAGASLTARNNEGRTLLMEGASNGATGCVTLLLEKAAYGLDLDAKANRNLTTLHLAAYHG